MSDSDSNPLIKIERRASLEKKSECPAQKFLEIVDNYMAYTLWKFHIDSLQIVISTNFFFLQKYFRILDQLGLNFYAINLKFSQIVVNYMAYILRKFHIHR